MAIKIQNGTGITAPIKTLQKNSVPNETTSEFSVTLSEKQKTVERNDSVVITNTVTQIRKSFESSSAEPRVDTERLMRIKAAIENGTYEVNAHRIAAKMIQFESLWSET